MNHATRISSMITRTKARMVHCLGALAIFVTICAVPTGRARAEGPPMIDVAPLARQKKKAVDASQAVTNGTGAAGTRAAPTPAASTDRSPPPAPMCKQPAGPWPDEEGALLEAPITERERNEVALQIARCARSVHRVADPWRVLALYRLEEQLGVPDEMRGIFGAIWCIEGGMRSEAANGGPIRGDHTESGQPQAFGPFQGHSWLWKWCGLEQDAADDLYLAARCYWSRVADRHQALGGRCGKKDWRVAEALTANGRKYQPEGCKAESGHYKELAGWRAAERRMKR